MKTDDFTEIKQIERYLNGEMLIDEKKNFEAELKVNESLRESVEIQKEIHSAAKRAVQRNTIRKVGKRYHVLKTIKYISVTITIATLSIIAANYLSNKSFLKETKTTDKVVALSMLDSLATNSPIANSHSQFFDWNGKDSAIVTKNGVLLSVTDESFLLDGKPYKGKAIIQWQEALDASSIIKAGLSTTSNGRLLETQGMFGLEVFTPKGKKLTLNPKVGVYVQAPVSEQKKGMQLFKGEKDKWGGINWIDPTPLEKLPISVPMSRLNFYPTSFVDTLDKLGKPKDKKYRDSLYLQLGIEPIHNMDYNWAVYTKSFGSKIILADYFKKESKWKFTKNSNGEYHLEGKLPLFFSGKIKYLNCKGSQKMLFLLNLNRTLFDYEFVINRDGNLEIENLLNKTNEFTLYSYKTKCEFPDIKYTITINNKQYAGNLSRGADINSPYGDNINSFAFEPSHVDVIKQLRSDQNFSVKFEVNENEFKISDSYKIKFNTKKQEFFSLTFIFNNCNSLTNNKVGDYGGAVLKVHERVKESAFLSPAKVLAFWNNQFNNTNLATKDFEKRMQVIHQICKSRNKATTTDLLNLYVNNLDKSIAYADEQAVKLGFPQFQTFADEHIGNVDIKNKHLHNLRSFYEKSIQLFEDELDKNKRDVTLLEEKLQAELETERVREKVRRSNREKQNFEEEKALNLKDVYKQLEIENVVGFTITETSPANVYNIDRFVEETTKERKTATYTDPNTGKKATITYNPFSLEVAEYEKYEQLFVYLLPSKMNSFQRLNLTEGKLNYPLNNLMDYDVVVLGIKDNRYFVSTHKKMNSGHLGKLKLKEIRENTLNRLLEKLTQKRDVDQPMSFKDELQWLKVEQVYSQFQRKKIENERFIDRMRKIVFPCWKEEEINDEI